jgi:hypothetical protein
MKRLSGAGAHGASRDGLPPANYLYFLQLHVPGKTTLSCFTLSYFAFVCLAIILPLPVD